MKFILSTDTSCDIFRNELDEAGIPYVPMTYTIDGKTRKDDFTCDKQYEDFYGLINGGATPTTSQVSAFLHEEFFDNILTDNEGDLVHLSLSSGLSATYSSACIGAENALKKHPNRKIFVIDTLAATQGHAYLLDEAKDRRDEGKTAQETADYLNDLKNRLQHWILVDDLIHLKRGGRVSGAMAYIGTVLNIKPILVIDSEGKLSVVHKSKGVKQGLRYFMQMMEKHGQDISNGKIYIAMANCPLLAEELKQLILSEYNCEVKIGWIGPIIGTHTGNNTLGMVFVARERIK